MHTESFLNFLASQPYPLVTSASDYRSLQCDIYCSLHQSDAMSSYDSRRLYPTINGHRIYYQSEQLFFVDNWTSDNW